MFLRSDAHGVAAVPSVAGRAHQRVSPYGIRVWEFGLLSQGRVAVTRPPAQVWWCCLLRVDHDDRPLQFGYESIVMFVVVGAPPLVRPLSRPDGDCHHSRAGCRRTTMEPSVKRFSVSLIRREPRSSEARWREADWNGEAENRSEATLCRPSAPRPASGRNVLPRYQNARCRLASGFLGAGRSRRSTPTVSV